MKNKQTTQKKSIINHSQFSSQNTSQKKGQQSFSPSQNQLIQKMLNINNGMGNITDSYSKTFKNTNTSFTAFKDLFDHQLKDSKEAQNQLNFNNYKKLEKLNSSTREKFSQKFHLQSMTSRHCNQSFLSNAQFAKLNNTQQSQLNIEEQLQTLEQYQKQQKIRQETTRNEIFDDEILNETGDFGQQPQNSEIESEQSIDQSFSLKMNSENQEDSNIHFQSDQKDDNNESLYSLQPLKENASISSNRKQYNSQQQANCSNQNSLAKISKHSVDEIEEISVQDLDKLDQSTETQLKKQNKLKNPQLDINKFKKPSVQNEQTESLEKSQDYKKYCENYEKEFIELQLQLQSVKTENLQFQDKFENQQKKMLQLNGQNLILKKKLQQIQENGQKSEIELKNKYQQQINQLTETIKNLEIVKTQELSSLQKLVNDTMIKNQILLQEKLDHQKNKKKLENKICTLEKYIESFEDDQSFNERSNPKMKSFIQNPSKTVNQKQSFSQNFQNFLQFNSPSQSVSPSKISSSQHKIIKGMSSQSPLFHKSLVQEDFTKSSIDCSKINKKLLVEKLKQYQRQNKKREKNKSQSSNQPPSFGASPTNNNNKSNVTNKFISINNEFFNQNYYVNNIQIDAEGKDQNNSLNLSFIKQYQKNKLASGIKSDRSKEKLLKTGYLIQPQSGNITIRQNSVNSQLKIC